MFENKEVSSKLMETQLYIIHIDIIVGMQSLLGDKSIIVTALLYFIQVQQTASKLVKKREINIVSQDYHNVP